MLTETIELKSLALSLTEDEFFKFCHENETLRIERDENGNIIIMPPSGFESEELAHELSSELRNWNKKVNSGHVVGSNTGFILQDKSMRSPDAAWISNKIFETISEQNRKLFLPACPEFVIEVKSPSDRVADLKKKMLMWLKNGVKLAWLINPEEEITWIYQNGKEPVVMKFHEMLDAGEVLPGFKLNIENILK